jgi:hypothetical protein
MNHGRQIRGAAIDDRLKEAYEITERYGSQSAEKPYQHSQTGHHEAACIVQDFGMKE